MSATTTRWLIRRDLPEVLAIERTSFSDPMTEDDFTAYLGQRNCIGMVAEREHQVIGYMLYALHKSRLVLLSLAVHPSFRRQGVGKQLLVKLWSKTSDRRTRIDLEVRETNLRAQLFFSAMGWRATGVVRNAYGDDEAAYRFTRRVRDGVIA